MNGTLFELPPPKKSPGAARRVAGPRQRKRYQPEHAGLAHRFALLGAIDREIADGFGISETTLNRWKLAHPEFREALQRGKNEADATVAERLFQRAAGYSQPEEVVRTCQGEVVVTTITRHFPPDVSAAIFWLRNRQKDRWRDAQRLEHTGRDGRPLEAHEASVADLRAELLRRGATLPPCDVIPLKLIGDRPTQGG